MINRLFLRGSPPAPSQAREAAEGVSPDAPIAQLCWGERRATQPFQPESFRDACGSRGGSRREGGSCEQVSSSGAILDVVKGSRHVARVASEVARDRCDPSSGAGKCDGVLAVGFSPAVQCGDEIAGVALEVGPSDGERFFICLSRGNIGRTEVRALPKGLGALGTDAKLPHFVAMFGHDADWECDGFGGKATAGAVGGLHE
jgi:hypothetical protein